MIQMKIIIWLVILCIERKKLELYRKLQNWFKEYGGKYDGTKYPVDGEGQMEHLDKFGTEKVVFKSF